MRAKDNLQATTMGAHLPVFAGGNAPRTGQEHRDQRGGPG
jgi:hypothetical protein